MCLREVVYDSLWDMATFCPLQRLCLWDAICLKRLLRYMLLSDLACVFYVKLLLWNFCLLLSSLELWDHFSADIRSSYHQFWNCGLGYQEPFHLVRRCSCWPCQSCQTCLRYNFIMMSLSDQWFLLLAYQSICPVAIRTRMQYRLQQDYKQPQDFQRPQKFRSSERSEVSEAPERSEGLSVSETLQRHFCELQEHSRNTPETPLSRLQNHVLSDLCPTCLQHVVRLQLPTISSQLHVAVVRPFPSLYQSIVPVSNP